MSNSRLLTLAAGLSLANINVLRVAAAVAPGEYIRIVGNGFDLYAEASVNGSVTAGRILVDVSAGGVKATGTLTSDNTNVTLSSTVTIGAKVYTFIASPATEGDVLRGADADSSLLNLIRAINHTGTPGTDYVCAAANTQVTAATSVTAHAFAVTAILTGAAGNAIATTETDGHLSWGAATLASGADPTAAQYTTALVTAWNAGQGQFKATRISANEVLFEDSDGGVTSATFSETLAGSNNAWASTTPFRGRQAPASPVMSSTVAVVPTAVEVALGNLHLVFPFAIAAVHIGVRVTSTGVSKAWDGGYTITANRITIDNSGSTDWAATDTVTVTAAP